MLIDVAAAADLPPLDDLDDMIETKYTTLHRVLAKRQKSILVSQYFSESVVNTPHFT
jgi:hypothetical protein